MSKPTIEGPFFVTTRAAREYGAICGYPADSDLTRETTELHQLSARAHLVRRQPNGLELWRVWGFHKRRLGLLVAEPKARTPGAKPALVQVLDEYSGRKNRGESD